MRCSHQGIAIKTIVLGVSAWILGALPAASHPHVFVEARSELVFDKEARLVSIRHVWRFDPAFTAFAVQGLDANGDGVLTHDELQPLAKVNVESLKEYDFFTYLSVARKDQKFVDPSEYWLDFSDGRLTLFYTLPLAKPVAVAGKKTILEVYDPSYFVDFSMTKQDPFVLSDAPAGCGLSTHFAGKPDPALAAELAQIPADVRDLPSQFMTETSTWSNEAILNCP
ncbi:ABC-type uncharacterized transport system substrate-binding protein [Breoghania corrubedonensis]|uniref:ABC-type uncharacterized transport system substrate-binding protein n=1 Tax=Breoghania corrubedonensis TaxID=665038 RepID=A0A2T5VHT6_9HYPH|nr:DUF1007 family protein [Breoghania corrubedonensis]PTW63286.1 ABC-type uncharacterized transport system substrate-binding protein [Breoghania corrubedonensis]